MSSVTGLGVDAGTVMVSGAEPSEGTTTNVRSVAAPGAVKSTATSLGEAPACTAEIRGAEGAPAGYPPLVGDV